MTAALRETKEEIGLTLSPTAGKIVSSVVGRMINGVQFSDIVDVWLFEYNGEVELTNATTDEVIAVKWMKKDDIKDYFNNNKLVPTLNYFFEEIEI